MKSAGRIPESGCRRGLSGRQSREKKGLGGGEISSKGVHGMPQSLISKGRDKRDRERSQYNELASRKASYDKEALDNWGGGDLLQRR